MSRYLDEAAPVEALALRAAIFKLTRSGATLDAQKLSRRLRMDVALVAGLKSADKKYRGKLVDEYIEFGHRFRGLILGEAILGETINYGADNEEMCAVKDTFRNRLARALFGDEHAVRWLEQYQEGSATIDTPLFAD